MKKLIDERGRAFGVISVIDIVVICIVILLATGFYMRFFVLEKTSAPAASTTSIIYKIKVEGVRAYTVDGLRLGDKLYADEDNTLMGTITDIESSPAEVITTLPDGSYTKAGSQGKYDVVITMQADGRIMNGRYYVNKTREINTNVRVDVYTKFVSFSSAVTEID